jgi:transposase InsO family protein
MTRQGWATFSVIKDLFDGSFVAHQLSPGNSIGLVIRTLELAQQPERELNGLLLHSDQASPYRCDPYHGWAVASGLTVSMSRRGHCWDHAPMENFFGHLKEEALRASMYRNVVPRYAAFHTALETLIWQQPTADQICRRLPCPVDLCIICSGSLLS